MPSAALCVIAGTKAAGIADALPALAWYTYVPVCYTLLLCAVGLVCPLPSLQEELGSPALAFVRLLVQLLSLDSAVEAEVRLLRRSLLRLVGVDEFSPAANWVDPCISFRLHDVICRCVCRGRQSAQLASQGGPLQVHLVHWTGTSACMLTGTGR